MTNKHGTVKLFTFSFEIDAPNIISCAPKIFSCVPKNLHLVAQVLPNSNLNFEPWCYITYIYARTYMYRWNMKKLYTSDFPRKPFFIIKSGWLIHFFHYSVYWCLCVSISFTFYCYSIILNASLAFFLRKQCTLPTTVEMGKINN